MLRQFLDYCSSSAGLSFITFWSDVAIAAAYFAIPITMAIVLRDRKQDIPYPWLWILFVIFIVACGMTHLAHVWSALIGYDDWRLHAVIGLITAVASVGTAVAFTFVLPQIRLLPSPGQQKLTLETAVRERTREKDAMIREINHRVGNQLQVLIAFAAIEARRAKSEESQALLQRLNKQLDKMGGDHLRLSAKDYSASLPPPEGAIAVS